MVLLAAIGCERFLGKIGFGQLGIVQSTANMVNALATLGLGVTATKNYWTLLDNHGTFWHRNGCVVLLQGPAHCSVDDACVRANQFHTYRLCYCLFERDAGIPEWRPIRL